MLPNIYKSWIVLAALAGLLAPVARASAQAVAGGEESATAVSVQRIDPPVRVDGVLDEPAWQQAAVVDLPYEVMPGRNTAAQVRTSCRVGYDARHLYFACEAADPDPAGIRAFLGDRDATDTQDRIGIALDTFADTGARSSSA